MTDSSIESAAGQELSQAEIEMAMGYLAEAAKGVSHAVYGLSEEQWRYRTALDRWSIAEVLEHLALLEELFGNRLVRQLRDAPATPRARDASAEDFRLRAMVSDRTITSTAPGRESLARAPRPITPTGAWSPAESLERFRAGRARTAEFLRTSSAGLRERMMEHPALGSLDGYQWVLFLAAHSVRHTKQILELQHSAGFPPWGTDYVADPAETAEDSSEG